MQLESNQTTYSEYFHGRAASQREVTGSRHPVIGTGTALGASHANYTVQRQAGVAEAEERLKKVVRKHGVDSLRPRQRAKYQRMLERRARFDAAQRSAERHARFQLAKSCARSAGATTVSDTETITNPIRKRRTPALLRSQRNRDVACRSPGRWGLQSTIMRMHTTAALYYVLCIFVFLQYV